MFAVFDEKEHFSVLVNVLQQFSFDLFDLPNLSTNISQQVLVTDLESVLGRCIVVLPPIVFKLSLDLILDVEVEVGIPLEERKQERVDQS